MGYLALHHHVRGLERCVDVAVEAMAEVVDVLRHGLMDEGRVLRHRVLERDDRRQRVDLWLEHLDRVGREIAALRHYRRDHLAGVAHPIARQDRPLGRHRARRCEVHGERAAGALEVGRDEHRAYSSRGRRS